MESKEKIIEAFRKNGFRATPQRIAIAQFVFNRKDHPTAEQVFDVVKRTHPSISLSTVYNTLNSMKDVNMVQELAFGNTHRYDPNTSIHVNLVCMNCGDIIDIENKTIEKEIDKISKRNGVSITGHRFDIYGICRKCEIDNKG
jgi:Fur family peroxide stress response transcriptional regulator